MDRLYHTHTLNTLLVQKYTYKSPQSTSFATCTKSTKCARKHDFKEKTQCGEPHSSLCMIHRQVRIDDNGLIFSFLLCRKRAVGTCTRVLRQIKWKWNKKKNTPTHCGCKLVIKVVTLWDIIFKGRFGCMWRQATTDQELVTLRQTKRRNQIYIYIEDCKCPPTESGRNCKS